MSRIHPSEFAVPLMTPQSSSEIDAKPAPLSPSTSDVLAHNGRPHRTFAQRCLSLFLSTVGAFDVSAAVAVVMPRDSMAAVHAWLGLGVMPSDPITGYLARSASLFCALTGALLIFAAQDVCRNRRLIGWMARCGLLTGIVLIGIDIAEGLPLWWILSEGPCCLVLSGIALGLQAVDRANH